MFPNPVFHFYYFLFSASKMHLPFRFWVAIQSLDLQEIFIHKSLPQFSWPILSLLPWLHGLFLLRAQVRFRVAFVALGFEIVIRREVWALARTVWEEERELSFHTRNNMRLLEMFRVTWYLGPWFSQGDVWQGSGDPQKWVKEHGKLQVFEGAGNGTEVNQ
jgi:hypothetical protein